jgi:hypothetical protein
MYGAGQGVGVVSLLKKGCAGISFFNKGVPGVAHNGAERAGDLGKGRDALPHRTCLIEHAS